MYAPVVTRFNTCGVSLDEACERYCRHIMAMRHLQEWIAATRNEPDDIEELDMEF